MQGWNSNGSNLAYETASIGRCLDASPMMRVTYKWHGGFRRWVMNSLLDAGSYKCQKGVWKYGMHSGGICIYADVCGFGHLQQFGDAIIPEQFGLLLYNLLWRNIDDILQQYGIFDAF